MRRSRAEPPRAWLVVLALAALLIGSLAAVRRWPGAAPWIGLADGLAVGVGLGASRLVPSYDESYDEFWEATLLTYLLGVFAVLVYWLRKERPSAFFLVECAAGTIGYLMLLFVPLLLWLSADLLLYFGTLVGWLFSGFFRPEYY
jgi:hypothetical protein